MTYTAPLQDIQFAMKQAGLAELSALPDYAGADEMAEEILGQAARIAADVLAPLNRIGDTQGSQVIDGKVQVPQGFAAAYSQLVEGGWLALSQPERHGGAGLPFLLHIGVSEMWCSANMALSLCPMLTSGATNALVAHASDALAQQYLPKMVSGEWTGTMNLTEPQAGSDLSLVKTRAEPAGDHYLIKGQKIFITWGEHEMTDNIVHLVLARLPDAPEGSAGISLFLVPKYLLDDDGNPGKRNDARVISVEHKLGIHASPTCVMSFGGDSEGAVGYLVGEPNRGLACMFTMMNHARLEVGLSGVSLGERAYQHALAYARERIQGRLPGSGEPTAIIEHGDVRRMLLQMRSLTEAARALAYHTCAAVDFSHHHPDEDARARSQRRVDLLTPVVKGWTTEIAQEITSLGIQIHGGMGYIEETGAAQYARDARITPIYEGTNGIQAADLVDRKVLRDGGTALNELLDEMAACAAAAGDELAPLGKRLDEAVTGVREAARFLLDNAADQPRLSGAVAFDFLMLLGHTSGAWKLIEAVQLAAREGANDIHAGKLAMARFYCASILPRTGAHLQSVLDGADATLSLPAEMF